MVAVKEAPARRSAPTVLFRETGLSGSFGDQRFTSSLSVSLTAYALVLEPAGRAGRQSPIELPLDAIILTHVYASRLRPRLEFHLHTRRGVQTLAFLPRNPRLWVEYLDELGVLLRPHRLDVKALPSRNLGYRVAGALWAAVGAGGALGLLLGLLRIVHGS